MAGRASFEQWVPVPLAEVFRFFSDPRNLPRLMPPELDARLVRVHAVPPPGAPPGPGTALAAGPGSEIVVSIRLAPLLPLRTEWVARITSWEPMRHFADEQARGPFRRWHHRHEFEAERRGGVDGTVVRDVLDYEVGLGPIGALAERVFVDRRLRSTFEHRQRALERLLAAR